MSMRGNSYHNYVQLQISAIFHMNYNNCFCVAIIYLLVKGDCSIRVYAVSL